MLAFAAGPAQLVPKKNGLNLEVAFLLLLLWRGLLLLLLVVTFENARELTPKAFLFLLFRRVWLLL